ncbi:MAG: hypothetical protein Q7R81_03435 [Candidatus Peregrinibacteria bacterium]|nr:hypothetical protein [Candidatus Peregrinibacteria bacterium]
MKQNRLILLIIGTVILGIALFGAFLESEEQKKELPPQAVTTNSVSSNEPADALPVDPYQRIVDLVAKYDEYPDISNLNDVNAKNPKPPFDVIVVMDHVQGCVTAKQKAQRIMHELYFDPVVGPTILRVKVINNEYVSASLGREGAQKMDASWWNDGPSNFIGVLQTVADYDMDMEEDATSRTVQGYTYAELQRGCQ